MKISFFLHKYELNALSLLRALYCFRFLEPDLILISKCLSEERQKLLCSTQGKLLFFVCIFSLSENK